MAVSGLTDRLQAQVQGVESDTSMVTTQEYVAHVLEVFVKKTDRAQFMGDRIRFLMLFLLLAESYLIALEVYSWHTYVWFITEMTM